MAGHRIPIRVGALVPARTLPPQAEVGQVAGGRPQMADERRVHEGCRRRERVQVRAAQDDLLLELLSVADDLERAIRAAQDDEPLCQGIELIHRELMRRLRGYGVERMSVQGVSFDPRRHEVVEVVAASSVGVEPGQVVRELRPGYHRDGRLLRPAWVVVAADVSAE